MTDKSTLAEGPECDFCEISIDPDESLESLYIGDLLQPEPIRIRQVGDRQNDYRLLGKPIGVYSAMHMALHTCPEVEINTSEVVNEVTAVGGETQFSTSEEMLSPQFETQRMEDKVHVDITIQPDEVEHEPDAEVCDICAKMFRSLGE